MKIWFSFCLVAYYSSTNFKCFPCNLYVLFKNNQKHLSHIVIKSKKKKIIPANLLLSTPTSKQTSFSYNTPHSHNLLLFMLIFPNLNDQSFQFPLKVPFLPYSSTLSQQFFSSLLIIPNSFVHMFLPLIPYCSFPLNQISFFLYRFIFPFTQSYAFFLVCFSCTSSIVVELPLVLQVLAY